MVTFVGLDLAWTPHHESGTCIITGVGASARLIKLASETGTPQEFLAQCRDCGEDVVVAIDAPLVVEPERRAERELARVFGAAKASPYTATVAFLTKMNGLAGLVLAKALSEAGFSLNPSDLTQRASGRFAIEVFPHPAHVELFSLAERIPYKKGRIADRRLAMGAYQGYLRTLLATELPRVLIDPKVAWILSGDAVLAGGKALKAIEDQLDALTCACIAHHCWSHGQEGFRVFGDDKNGSIVVPLRMPRPATSSPALSSP